MPSCPRYSAYACIDDRVRFTFDGRDVEAGWLGTISTEDEPIVRSETADAIEAACLAYLGSHPQPLIYITDAQKRVLRTLINEEHHEIVERQRSWILRLIACLLFAITCLLNAETPYVGTFWGFALTAIIYLGIVRIGLWNEIESAIFCYLILIVAVIAFGGG